MNERREQMLDLRLAGHTYQQIAEVYGISRQAVQQQLSPPKRVRAAVIERAAGKCESCGIMVGSSGHVHHVGVEGERPETYETGDNLELLCVSCHRFVHHHGRYPRVGERPALQVKDDEPPTHHCVRCGHRWTPRRLTYPREDGEPRTCASCKSPYWDRAPRRKAA